MKFLGEMNAGKEMKHVFFVKDMYIHMCTHFGVRVAIGFTELRI
jgi:hypothetical protein